MYDLFGLIFSGHPNLQRIMMPMDWTTHPLRKDYPLTGFDLPEPHWGGQVPYDTDPGVDSHYYEQTLRTPEGRELNERRSHINPNQEPGTKERIVGAELASGPVQQVQLNLPVDPHHQEGRIYAATRDRISISCRCRPERR